MKCLFKIWNFLIFSCLFFSACVSKPKFSGRGDLCGLVVDENSAPVKDFTVYCKPASKSLTQVMAPVSPVKTNESGLFVFYDLESGDYCLDGEKEGYLRIINTAYRFDDRSKIICLQTKSFNASILWARELLGLGQSTEAKKMLEEICCEPKSYEYLLLQMYQFFAEESDEKRKALLAEIKKHPASEEDFPKRYISQLEEVIQ